jgi:hypothetical protein
VALETKAIKIYYFNILLKLYKAIFYFKKNYFGYIKCKKKEKKGVV